MPNFLIHYARMLSINKSFWEAIHNEVQLILKVNFPLDVTHYLLGMSPLRMKNKTNTWQESLEPLH